MESQLLVRKVLDGDEAKIVELLSLVFEGWPNFNITYPKIEHWKWKFLDTPHDEVLITVAEVDEKIIGCHHQIPQRIKMENGVVPCSMAVDFAVHPDFRRKGISKQISELNDEVAEALGVKYVFWVSGNPIIIKSSMKVYPYLPFKILHLVNINNVDRHLLYNKVDNKLIKKTGFLTLKTISKIKNLLKNKPKKLNKGEIYKIDKFDTDINNFWIHASKHYKFIVERNANYLNWRYCDKRGGEYSIYLIKDEEIIKGYLVLRITQKNRDYQEGYIVDLFTLPDRNDLAEQLILKAIDYFKENEINAVNCWMIKKHPYEKILRRYGFIDSKNKMQFFYQSFDSSRILENEVFSVNEVYLSYGDVDWI